MSSESPPWFGVGHEEGLFLTGPQNAAVEAAVTEAEARRGELDAVMGKIGAAVRSNGGELVGLKYGGSRANREIAVSGEGLPRTQETVQEAAAAGGVDLTGVDVVIIDQPDEIRYLDYESACAYTPCELGGDQIRLGPASFADREMLVARLAHEKTHVEQLRALSDPDFDSETMEDLEEEVYASEAPALERLQEHDSDQVRGRDNVRPAEPGRDPGPGRSANGSHLDRDNSANRGQHVGPDTRHQSLPGRRTSRCTRPGADRLRDRRATDP